MYSFASFNGWKPDKTRIKRPVYISLSNLIEEDIRNGNLKGGEKLPSQRELADYLGINFSTVSRAYRECESKNLIYGIEGSGTFVSPQVFQQEVNSMDLNKIHRQNGYNSKIIMGFVAAFDECNFLAEDIIAQVCHDKNLQRFLSYENPTGMLFHKEVGVQWMRRYGIRAEAGDVIVTSGTMNAISMCLTAFFEPGDKIAVDYYVYFNFIQMAQSMHLQLVPIEGDSYGMLPDQLDYICENYKLKGIMLMPSCANPTTVFMPITRKYQLARIIEKHGLLLLEDEYFAFATAEYLEDYAVPLREILPAQTIYLSTTSYSICSGLRIGFMVLPREYYQKGVETFCNMNVKSSALDAEIVCRLIESGKADEISKEKIRLAGEAGRIFDSYFPDNRSGHPYAFFRWLQIPEFLKSDNSVGWQILARGVHSFYSRRFVCGKQKEERFLRVSLSSASSMEEMEEGLIIIKKFFEEKGREKKKQGELI